MAGYIGIDAGVGVAQLNKSGAIVEGEGECRSRKHGSRSDVYRHRFRRICMFSMMFAVVLRSKSQR